MNTVSCNRLWEFHQIYTLGALGDKGELIRFWGQKVSVTTRADMVKNHLLKMHLSDEDILVVSSPLKTI